MNVKVIVLIFWEAIFVCNVEEIELYKEINVFAQKTLLIIFMMLIA